MAARSRSPNYPSVSLGDAIEMIRKVYQAEKRAKFPRETLASHLGYSSLNGRALSKIGAIRAYGLIDGREDALSVSRTALAILEAPKDSADYVDALHEAFNAPNLYQSILEEYGEDTPSEQTLRWWLTQQGYVGDAADKALSAFLAGQELVNSAGGRYSNARQSQDEPAHAATASAPRPRDVPPVPRIVEAVGRTSVEPDFKIQLGDNRWLLIEVKGGKPKRMDFVKLEMFAKFQRGLLELVDDSVSENDKGEEADPLFE
ncbi:MAG: hypothetical protein KJZ64_02645 [Sphingomonadaceae bacterium]|nr:hypothetical protein [Sphingomonadaceae bacterium]